MSKTIIIIVTYNGMKWVKKNLESTEPYPVIVVDNCSTDGTADYIKKHFPEVTLLTQKKNLGFGAANNLGISIALKQGAEYVFLLNQDAYLEGDCLERLVQLHQGNEKYGILSPIHLNGTGDHLDRKFASLYVSFNRNPQFFSDYVLGRTKKEIYEVPFVNAAGWLISKNCFETVGGFDPIFFHYGEDENYCQRVRFHRMKVGVAADNFLRHDRENRNETSNLGQKEYFEKLEVKYKVRFGNINSENINSIEELLKKKKKELVEILINFPE